MGGSGGNYFDSKIDPNDLKNKIDNEIEGTKKQELDSEVSGIISKMLTDFNNREDAVDTHLKNIVDILTKDLDSESFPLKFGGSVSKHTYINGLSDIDVLALIDKTELANMKPEDIKNYFFKQLKESLPKTNISKGTLAITVHYKEVDIQILPAAKSGDSYKIPDSSGKRWSLINPKKFADILTKVNIDNGMKVVPTIKIAKSIISEIPNNLRITGYHTETLAVEVFKGYNRQKTTKSMLTYFFNEAPKYISTPQRDKTHQSKFVDEYCGKQNSKKRIAVSNSIARIGKAMVNANGACSLNQWEEILNP
jgi:hypothetical protein